jgi:hypothetical protein
MRACLSAVIVLAILSAPQVAAAQSKTKNSSQGEWIADVERPAQKAKKKPTITTRCQRPGAPSTSTAC